MAGISDETYELLRWILTHQNGRYFSLEETKEVGDGLIDFYELLQKLDGEEVRLAQA